MFGLPRDFLKAARDPTFEVWSENWQALEVFTACHTQWRVSPMGSLNGLDYTALESVMRLTGVEDVPVTFHKVRLIEQGALSELRRQQR